MNLLQIEGLKIWDSRNEDKIVKSVSFDVKEHSCVAIVGESGSGKSMTAKAINKLHKPWIKFDGAIKYKGKNLLNEPLNYIKSIRGSEVFMIFQNGMSAFDPSVPIGTTLYEILNENLKIGKGPAEELIISSMEKVLLKNPKDLLKKYPHQLSGGMLQRFMIALAIALRPRVIIADEPTTALDCITEYEIVKELIDLRNLYNVTMIFISHDLGIVRKLADYVVFLKDGKVVEQGAAETVFHQPESDYAKTLISTYQILGDNYKKLMKRMTENA